MCPGARASPPPSPLCPQGSGLEAGFKERGGDTETGQPEDQRTGFGFHQNKSLPAFSRTRAPRAERNPQTSTGLNHLDMGGERGPERVHGSPEDTQHNPGPDSIPCCSTWRAAETEKPTRPALRRALLSAAHRAATNTSPLPRSSMLAASHLQRGQVTAGQQAPTSGTCFPGHEDLLSRVGA